MTPEEVAAQIERMHVGEGAPPRLPGERAVPPQGTALVGTESPPETFGATPSEVAAVRKAIEYIAGGPKEKRQRQLTEEYAQGVGQGGFLEERPGQAPLVRPYEAFKELASPEGQYRVGEQDVRGAKLGAEVSTAAAFGSMPFPRPAGSLGIFMGMREAEELLYHGRPAAYDALKNAEIMEAAGRSPEEIRAEAHKIFREAGEKDLGQIWKPNYEGSEWRFELLPHTDKPGAKLSKFDPKKPTKTLGEQYKNPDLYKAMPGIEETELTRFGPVPFGTHGYYDPAVPAAGIKGEISVQRPSRVTGITEQDTRDLVIAELQHAIQDVKGWPRGGSPTEFEPGGRLAHYLKPGETPDRAYARLAGEIESKVAKERANYSTKAAREESVEETIDRMWLTTRDPIIEFYRGQRIRAHAEGPLARLAGRLAEGARQTVADMKASGASPEEIAARLQKDYGSPVTAEEVSSDRGWWNVPQSGAGGYSRWTPDQRAMLLNLHRQGVSYEEIARQLRVLGRETNPRAIKDKARALGLPQRQRGGYRWGQRKDNET